MPRYYPDRLSWSGKRVKKNTRIYLWGRARNTVGLPRYTNSILPLCVTFTKPWAAYSHTGRTQFLKTKIIHIHITKAQSLATDTREDVLYQEEMATIHSSERQVRRAARLITRMLDSSSALPTSNRDNLRVMTVFEPVSKSHNIELRISLTNGARSVQGSAHESEGGLGGENHGHGMQFGGASWGSE